MPQHRLTLQQIAILGFVSLSAPMGDACLARGMAHLGALSVSQPLALLAAVFTPWILGGIALLIGFFASYLTALSWADLTFVMPATSLGYVFMALLAHFWLHEAVSWQRWAGIALITLGAAFVTQGPANTTPPANLGDALDSGHGIHPPHQGGRR